MKTGDLAKMQLPPHRRIDLKSQIKQRLIDLGKSPTDIDCALAEDANHQPTIVELVWAAAQLNCAFVVTDIQLVPLEKAAINE